jgi:pimeloyl-ACP methyl ester carboxylesterase
VKYILGWTRRKWLLGLMLGTLALVAYTPVTRLIKTIRLLTILQRIASGDSVTDASLRIDRISRKLGSTIREAIIYRPQSSSPSSAVILIPGVSELGCDHPRLVSLSRALAAHGFLVLTPDIKMLRKFLIYPPPLDDISFWLREVRNLEGGPRLRRVGLAGISFSATLAFIAAAQPQNRDLADYLLGVGPFDDITRCSHFWFDAGQVTVGPGCYPTRYYARWIIMIAALDLLPSADDRRFLDTVLRNLLLQKQLPPHPDSISPQGKRWYELAVMREDQEDPELSRQIETRVATMLHPALATARPAAEIRCPVFLAHGAYDDLIPYEESLRLKEKITQARSYVLVSPFLTHTHPLEKPLGWRVRFRAGFDVLLFFYHITACT